MNHVSNAMKMSNSWNRFCDKYALSEPQKNQYLIYADLLVAENKKYNLTALTDPDDIIHYHFDDALSIAKYVDFNKYKNIADIGSGCGVPGIILACYRPDTHFFLIEVIQKRVSFLEHVCRILNITNCTIVSVDFKTYLRKKKHETGLFIARASLALDDLLYIYSGASCYQNSELIYWGSPNSNSISHDKLKFFHYPYEVGNKKREYIHVTKK